MQLLLMVDPGRGLKRGSVHDRATPLITEKIKRPFMVTTIEMTKAIQEFLKNAPPISEEDIKLVKHNRSISFISKIMLIRKMRKAMK